MVTSSLAGGGAERAVVLLSEGFLRRQHEVTVVSLSGPTTDSFRLPAGVKRMALDVAGHSSSLIRGLWTNRKRLVVLRKALRSTRPDLVISHMTETNVLTRLALVNTGCPVVLVEHSNPALNGRRGIWRLLRRRLYPGAVTVVSVSGSINDYFRWLPESKKTVIPNPARASAGGRAAKQLPGAGQKHQHLIAAMGRLIRVKGFDRLLPAFAALAQGHPDWQLVIMGEGELRSDLESQINTLGLSGRVRLAGFVDNPFVILSQAEFFVMSSRSEGFPYSLLEAMSCGLPAVAMDCPTGPREIIRDGIDGILVPDGDIKALTAAMDQLMSDRDERQRLAGRAAEVIERFDSERVMAQWEALFLRIGKRLP